MELNTSAAAADAGQKTRAGEPPDTAPPRFRRRKSYSRLAKQGVAWSLLRETVTELLQMPTTVILARLLNPYNFGVFAAARFFVMLGSRLTNFGFNTALVRMKDMRPIHASSVFVLNIATGFVLYAILAASATLTGRFFHSPEIASAMPIAALAFLINPPGAVSGALLVRDMEFRYTACADWVGASSMAASSIVLAWYGYGYWALLYGSLIGDSANTITKMCLARWRPSFRYSQAAINEVFSFGAGVFFKRLLDYAANNFDNLVIGRTIGVAPLGIYDKAFTTMNQVLMRVNTGGPNVSFRIFALIYEEADRFRRAYAKVVLTMTLFAYPLLAGMIVAGHDLIYVMYGPKWLPAVVPFQILCVAGALKMLNEYAGSAAQAFGHIWSQVWRQAVYTLLIGTCVYALSRYGLRGAAVGVLIATVVMTVLIHALLVRIAKVPVTGILRAQLPGLACAGCVALAEASARAAALAWHPGLAPWQLLVTQIAAAAMCCLVFLKVHRFAAVRAILLETAEEVPAWAGRIVRAIA